MRHAILPALILGLAAAPAPTPQAEAALAFPLTVRFKYDFYCNGTDGIERWVLADDGTFSASSGDGTWSYVHGIFTLIYGNDVTYTGLRNGARFEGDIAGPGGLYGCWIGRPR